MDQTGDIRHGALALKHATMFGTWPTRFLNRHSVHAARSLFFCGVIFCLSLNVACRKSEAVATVQDESEAIEIITALNERGIEAQKEKVAEEDAKGWRVVVTENFLGTSKLTLAFQALKENGLPRRNDKGMEGAYEEKGLFPSDSAQKAQRLKELKTEVERQLRLLPAVLRVNVNLVLPEDDTINLNPYSATASVLIIDRDREPAFTTGQVQDLVAKAVPKLKPENVGVVVVHEPVRLNVATPSTNRRRLTMTYAIGIFFVLLFLGMILVGLVRRLRRLQRNASNLPEPVEAQISGPSLAASAAAHADKDAKQGLVSSAESLTGISQQKLKPEPVPIQ